jgi:hypothetical protein
MHTFFHGWRRKAVCVALMIAIALMGLWIRSLRVVDLVQFPSGKHEDIRFVVTPDGYCWEHSRFENAFPSKFYWFSTDASDYFSHRFSELSRPRGFTFVRHTGIEGIHETTHYWVPHWFCTVSTTLLSAYLLLVPSRKRPASKPHA